METSSQIYVNPLSDAGFKALLCDPANKRDLIALLNAFLPSGRRVSDLEYATTEIPGVTLSNKASRVDLRCTGADGEEFIVEVQRSPQPHFFRRCVYYASRIYALGSERGDGQRYELPPVYLLALTDRDFGFDRSGAEWDGHYTSSYTFRESLTGQVEEDAISIIFVELYRFWKSSYGECGTDEERWCWTLKNMWRMPDADMITERDMYNILETARQEGEAKGEAKAALQIAKNLLAAGMPEEQVIAMTGLTAEQLAALK